MHDTPIDDEAILADLEGLAGGAAPGQQGQPMSGDVVLADPVAQLPKEYVLAGQMIIGMFANKAAPNWPIDAEMQTEWANAFAACANDLAPGGIGNIENWGPWGKLAFASGMVALAGMDMSTMTLRPMHKPDPREQQHQHAARPAEFSTGGQGGGGDFTTAG
jgi:hypothetical protein